MPDDVRTAGDRPSPGAPAEAWRLIDLAYGTGAWNQAVDEVLLDSVVTGASGPVLRIYGWSELCVSIGSSETIGDLSPDGLSCLAAKVVRRHSGGTAVMHDHQIAVALVLPADHKWVSPDITRTYEAVGAVGRELARQLEMTDVALALPAEVAAQGWPAGPLRAACLAWLAPYELIWRGRKLLGHSQVRRRGCVLHHCVLSLDFDPGRTVSVLASAAAEDSDALAKSLRSRVASLGEALGHTVADGDARDAVLTAMRALGASLVADTLTPAEIAEARRLVSEKYGSASWTYRR